MRWALALLGLVLLGAAPADAFTVRGGFETMGDGTRIAYDLYEPDGAAPASGWPGVVVLHGLGGTKDSMAPIASYSRHTGTQPWPTAHGGTGRRPGTSSSPGRTR